MDGQPTSISPAIHQKLPQTPPVLPLHDPTDRPSPDRSRGALRGRNWRPVKAGRLVGESVLVPTKARVAPFVASMLVAMP